MLRVRACGAAAPASVPALVRARLAKAKPTSSFASSAVASSAVSSSSTLEELAADRKGGASSSGESHVAQSRSEVRLFSPPCGSELGSHGESCLLKCPSELRIVFRATFSSSYGLPIAKQLFPEPGHLLFDTTIVAGLARVVLKKGKTQIFRDGSPMVYSGAVDRIIGRPPPKTGDIVLVADGSEKPIGWGLYNSVSMFCVRLMQLEEEAKRDPTSALNMEKLLEERIFSAVDLRRSLDLPSTNTNAYRLINSEGDRLSGLIVDVFADVAVIASSAAWVEKYRQQIQLLVNKVSSVNYIKWRSSTDILKEEGLDMSEQIEPAPSSHSGTVKVMENGIVYLVSVEGQKTGFYADQRESRDFISRLSKDKKVLDLCCYSGGFALSAAKGGATNVIGIDSSGSAVDLANENIPLNKFDAERISFIKEDASAFMKGAISRNELWDLVVLDPPKLAPRKKVLQSASGMYRSLNALAMQVVKPGGLLMTCSCSGAMTQSGLFLKTIQGAASMAGRKVTVLRQAGAACDHPIDPSYPEGQYLSNYLLRVM